MQYTISLIGSGNVAWHLGQALEKAGFKIGEVYSRNPQHAGLLAERLYDAQVISSLDFSESPSDVFILCVPDDAIAAVADGIILPDEDSILCHTSGTQSLNSMGGRKNAGVFYPLQTFSKNRRPDFGSVPFCIEASDSHTEAVLVEIAQSLSRTVYLVDSQERKMLHMAAVFACNFTNHLLALAKELLDREGLDFELLKPLIRETFTKALEASDPAAVQTGPAVRGDFQTIRNHLDYLQDMPHREALYKLLTDSLAQHARK
jgi:predicted short-subunit dehydrogenase-like oxidoreductase (DUF2520 family)